MALYSYGLHSHGPVPRPPSALALLEDVARHLYVERLPVVGVFVLREQRLHVLLELVLPGPRVQRSLARRNIERRRVLGRRVEVNELVVDQQLLVHLRDVLAPRPLVVRRRRLAKLAGTPPPVIQLWPYVVMALYSYGPI